MAHRSSIALAAVSAVALMAAGSAAIAQPAPAPAPAAAAPAAAPAPAAAAPAAPPATVEPVESVGRGAPVTATEFQLVGPGGPYGGSGVTFRAATETQPERAAVPPVFGAAPGAVPEGVTPLERDIYTTTDFYADRELWTDPLYFRCSSSIGLELIWGAYPGSVNLTGDNPPVTAAWGHCDRDYPREAIVSPYEFDTAQAHYEALMAEAVEHGGPTEYTRDNPPPDWEGRYTRSNTGLPPWIYMHINQMPTILSLLTEEYQTRFMQQAFHGAVNNAAQWPASYCWPEGMMRWWSGPGPGRMDLSLSPEQALWIGGVADNFIRQVQIGREFNMEGETPRLGQDVPRWYGETVGFWDGEALISWTSNIQGWTTHSAFEHSNELQIVEIYVPRTNEDDTFAGLRHEAIFYDPAALVEPVRVVRDLNRASALNEGDPFVFIECLQTIYPQEGRATPIGAGQEITIRATDWYGRPWAQIWEEYFEEGMERPEAEGLFGF